MTMGVEKRSNFWDVLRGFAMLIVVFGHSLQVCNGGDPNNPLHLVIRYFQMELLFFDIGALTEVLHIAVSCNERHVPGVLVTHAEVAMYANAVVNLSLCVAVSGSIVIVYFLRLVFPRFARLPFVNL